jgi:hypothetical protein
MQSPARVAIREIGNTVEQLVSPAKIRLRSSNQTTPPTLLTTPTSYKACASGIYCDSPWAPIPTGHKCKGCSKFMHFWCRGNHPEADDFSNEYCILCSNGKPHEENTNFQIPTDPSNGLYTSELHKQRSSDSRFQKSEQYNISSMQLDDDDGDHVDDGDDDGGGDDDDNDDDNGMGNEIFIYSDDFVDEDHIDEEDTSKKWKTTKIPFHEIQLTVDTVSKDMKQSLHASVEIMKRNLKHKRTSSIIFPSTIFQSSPEVLNFSTIINYNFCQCLLQLINENEIDNESSSTKTTMNQLEIFIRCILCCAFYRKSATALWKHRHHHPTFEKLIRELGGISVYSTIMKNIRSNKSHHGITWENYFDENKHLRAMEKILSQNCSSLSWHM